MRPELSFAVHLARVMPFKDSAKIVEVVEFLSLCAKKLHKLNERECVGDLSRYQLKRREALISQIKGICDDFGFSFVVSGDPRYYTIRVSGETWVHCL